MKILGKRELIALIMTVVTLGGASVGVVHHYINTENSIATVSEQVVHINDTLPQLETTNAELESYIEALEETIGQLQTDLMNTDRLLAAFETEVYVAVDAEKTAILYQLETEKLELEEKINALNVQLLEIIKKKTDTVEDTSALETNIAALQTQMNIVNKNITSVKTELEQKISISEKTVLASVNTLKEKTAEQITQIRTQIIGLKAEDMELEKKIAALQTYADDELEDMKDWAKASFCTLEQYQEVQKEISAIYITIDTINTAIEILESDVYTQIAQVDSDIENLEINVKADIKSVSDSIKTAYTEAISTAKTEITQAYTDELKQSIVTSEEKMTEWVNKMLADGYYTIAELDVKLAAVDIILEGLKSNDTTLEGIIEAQEKALETAKTELTKAYNEAITVAIDDHNGKITKQIAADIEEAKSDLQTQIDMITEEIESIKERISKLESNVEALLAQIQSVNFIPRYDDGKVKVITNGNDKYAFFDFMISPSSVLADIDVDTLKQYFTMQAVYTDRAETRGDTAPMISFVDMEILEVAYNADLGVLTIKASGNKLSADFYNESMYASAFLTIKTGVTEIMSGYIPLVAYSTVWTNMVNIDDWIGYVVDVGIIE